MGDHQSSLLVIPWATVTLIHPNVQTHPQLSATQHISTGAKFKFAFFISQFVPIFHPWNTVPSPTPIFHRKLYIYIWFIKTGNYITPPGMLCTRVTTDLELTADHVTAFPLWQRCDHREGSASKREGAYGTLCGFCCEPKTSETITSKNCILPGEAVHSFDPGTRRQSQVDLWFQGQPPGRQSTILNPVSSASSYWWSVGSKGRVLTNSTQLGNQWRRQPWGHMPQRRFRGA